MIKALKYIASIQTGLTFRTRLEHSPEGNVLVIQMKDFGADNRIDCDNLTLIEMQNLKERQMVQIDDLIFRSRGFRNSAALIDREVKDTTLAAPLLRVRVRDASVLPAYLCWFINSPVSQSFLQRHATGTAMRMVGKKALDALEVQIPSITTQQRIIELSRLAEREQILLASLSEKRKQLTDSKLMQAITTPREP